MNIKISVDHSEAIKFVEWLNNLGHNASVSNLTGNYVDGVRTSCDESANNILASLWERYCND